MIDQHKTLAEKFLKKGFPLYFFSFIIGPIGYIIKIIISGELSVSEVGILYGIISLVTLISTYNDLGMTESLKYFIPKYLEQKRYDRVKSIIFYALFIQIITSLFIAFFFWFGADYIANNYFKSPEASSVLKVFALFFIGINIFQTINNFFIAVQDTFSHKITELIRMFFIMIFVIGVLFFDVSNLINYSYSWLVGLYLGIIATLYLFYKKYYKKYFSKEKILIETSEIKSTLKYASLVFVGAGAATVLGQMDMQMIIYYLGTTDAGYYTNYLAIIGIPFILIGPIFALLFPVFSEFHSKGDYSKIKMIKDIFTKNFLAIGIMFNIFFFVFAEILAFVLFGEKFITSGIILKYSILLLVFNFLLQINFSIMAGIGKVKQRVQIIFIALVFNFIANIILIKYMGVYGAALATSFGWILIWVLSELYLGKKYFINFDFKNIFKNIIILGSIRFLFNKYGLSYLYDFSRIQNLGFLALLFFIWSSIFVFINKSDFKYFIGEIKKLRKGVNS